MREWSIIFYFSAALSTAAAIIFIIMGSSEKQPWNNPPEESMSPEGPRVSYVASSDKAGLQPKKWDDALLQESSDDIDLSTYPGKGKMFDDRPWRTDSFPDLRDDDEPSVFLKK
ncbi:hypothetical protein TNCV_2888071 [Trichonephila clavipes]|nr:hypothetical protein TNCV_2888071 [Trichonephila clavipes]